MRRIRRPAAATRLFCPINDYIADANGEFGPAMQFALPSASSFASALQGGRFRAYLEILAFGSGARLFGLASQFVVLLILSRVLSKDSFGDLMTAFGFYRLAAMALGVGGSLVLLYHISRHPNDKHAEIRLHRYSAVLGALFARPFQNGISSSADD
jgi:putative flippase GtrA